MPKNDGMEVNALQLVFK